MGNLRKGAILITVHCNNGGGEAEAPMKIMVQDLKTTKR